MSDYFFDDSKDHAYRDERDEPGPDDRPAISPGKVTLTSRIVRAAPLATAHHQSAQKPSPTAAPVQREARTPLQLHPGAEDEMSAWDIAFRPDLYSPQDSDNTANPIQRKRQGERDKDVSLPAPGGGAKLPEDVQAQMETAFGADFSAVRIHEGPQAAAVGALAYTQGTDIHFQPGQYDPRSRHGRELLGHELTHVVQQSQGRVHATTQAKGVAINNDSSLEREADEMGARAARGGFAMADNIR